MYGKSKVVLIVSGCLVMIAAASSGFWLWHHNKQHASVAVTAPASQQQSETSQSSELNVSNNTQAAQLGQLQPSQQQSQSQAQSQANNPAPSASPNPFDPSTFAQYDKYKNGQAAYFGDVQKGTGTALTANHTAVVVYKGWLTNGQLFDESKTGSDGKLQAFSFTLGAHQVIPGWEEGLNGMQVGGTRLLIIPPAVGYGSQTQGAIPANSVLVFEVQLVAVQ